VAIRTQLLMSKRSDELLDKLRKHQDGIKSIRKSDSKNQKIESNQRDNSKPVNIITDSAPKKKNVPHVKINTDDYVKKYKDGTELVKYNSVLREVARQTDKTYNTKKLVSDEDRGIKVPKSNPLDDGRVNPEDFIEHYPDGTKLYKINSFIRALAKHVDD